MGAVIYLFLSAGARNLPDLMLLGFVLLAQTAGVIHLLRGPAARSQAWVRRLILACATFSALVLVVGFLLMFARVARHFHNWTASWIRGSAIIWAMMLILWTGAWLVWLLVRAVVRPQHSRSRRGFLIAAGAALFAAPVAGIGYGVFIQRRNIRLREQTIAIPGLPEDLVGIRIVQLSDIHLSPFLSEKELAHAVALANETYAHLALVTGDMITSNADPLDTCLKHLAGLRSEAGVFGCLGNHEIYAHAEDYATEHGARLGIRYLRMEAEKLKFGSTIMNLAGVDYQLFHSPYLVGAEKLVKPGMFNVLMSHNPDVFPVAARQGFDLTVAGHTHGGQVRLEILREDLNIARIFTPFVDGLYRNGGKSIFVSRGIGTIGAPVRLGAPPEVALLRLCRS
jgi:uncharacterized protein